MRKIILSILIMALIFAFVGCKKPVNQDKPGYVPPDLEYPGNENIDAPSTDTPRADQTLPFDTNPSDKEPATTNSVQTEPVPASSTAPTPIPEETTPVYTTPVNPDESDNWFDDEPEDTIPTETETAAPEDEPVQTEDTYVVPDVIIVPTEIPYVITSEAGYHEFIHSPDLDYFSEGVNIYYTVPGEEGVIHMNKLDAYGFMKYIGEYSGSSFDLDIELIEFVISGKLQDELVARKLNPQIDFVGGVSVQYGDLPRFIWVRTSENDYFVTFGKDEGEILVCTRDDFFEILEN